MSDLKRRVGNLENENGGDEVRAIGVFWGEDEDKEMVTITQPKKRRGERMTFAQFRAEFPDTIIIHVNYEEQDEPISLNGEGEV